MGSTGTLNCLNDAWRARGWRVGARCKLALCAKVACGARPFRPAQRTIVLVAEPLARGQSSRRCRFEDHSGSGLTPMCNGLSRWDAGGSASRGAQTCAGGFPGCVAVTALKSQLDCPPEWPSNLCTRRIDPTLDEQSRGRVAEHVRGDAPAECCARYAFVYPLAKRLGTTVRRLWSS